MAMPPALQRYANDVVKGTYKEISKLWSACQAKNPDLAIEMKKLFSNVYNHFVTPVKLINSFSC